METKDYAEKINGFKNEILSEIRELLGENGTHEFKEPFFVHYIEGETASTETCLAVKVQEDGMVAFYTTLESDVTSLEDAMAIDGEIVFNYEPQSFFDIIDNLKKEIKADLLKEISEFVKGNGNNVCFNDGEFVSISEETAIWKRKLNSIRLVEGGMIVYVADYGDKIDEFDCDSLDIEELRRLYVYLYFGKNFVALNVKQIEAVQQLKKALSALKECNVKIVYDYSKHINYFINGDFIKDIDVSNLGDDTIGTDITKMMQENPTVQGFYDNILYSDDDEKVYCHL